MFSEEIAQLGVAAPGLPDGAVGWTAQSALKVFQSLPGKVAVGSVYVFDRVQWGFGPSDDVWRSFRQMNESAAGFALRTRNEAQRWVETFPRREILFVIEFDDQAAAAEAAGSA